MVRKLAPRERRFHQVGGVPLPFRAAGAHERVRLVHEQDDGHRRGLDLLNHRLQPVLELTLHARARLQQAEVEREQPYCPQRFGYVVRGDAEREALHHRGLADARLAGEDRVVLPPAAQDIDDLADFRIAAEHRIQLAGARSGGQVDAVLVQGLRLARSGCRDSALLSFAFLGTALAGQDVRQLVGELGRLDQLQLA